MEEIILNIYVIINNNVVEELKAVSYESIGTDEQKIEYLKSQVEADFEKAEAFSAPVDKKGNFMQYRVFAKFEKRNMYYELFGHIFGHYKTPDYPLICVTPVLDNIIKTEPR